MPDKLETSLGRVLAMRDPSQWLPAHMDSYWETSEPRRNDAGWFHPSSLSHQCDAFLAFQFLGLEQRGTTPAKLRRIWDNGHSTEGRWQTALLRAGLATLKTKQERLIVIPQYRVRGECDNVVRHPETGELFVLEFKTKNHDLFTALRAPDPDHVVQVHPYMFGKGILQALIVYECKNDQDVKVFHVPFDGPLWATITTRLENILARLGRHREVIRTPVPDESRCAFVHLCAGYDFSKAAT